MLLLFIFFFSIFSAYGMEDSNDPLQKAINEFKRSVVDLNTVSTENIISHLKTIFDANSDRKMERTRNFFFRLEPLDFWELEEKTPIGTLLNIIFHRINQKISQGESDKLEETLQSIKNILSSLPGVFTTDIEKKLIEYWSDIYQTRFPSKSDFLSEAFYPTKEYVSLLEPTLFDSVQEILYFDQLIKNRNNIKMLLKINALDFGRFTRHKEKKIADKIRHFSSLIDPSNVFESIEIYRKICSDPAFNFLQLQGNLDFHEDFRQELKKALTPRWHWDLAYCYQTLDQSDDIDTELRDAITEIIQMKIIEAIHANQEGNKHSVAEIGDFIRFMYQNRHLPDTTFRPLRHYVLQNDSSLFGLQSLAAANVNSILAAIDEDSITEIAQYFTAYIEGFFCKVTSLEELVKNLELFKHNYQESKFEVNLGNKFIFYIDLFEGLQNRTVTLEKKEVNFHSIPKCPITNAIMEKIWSKIRTGNPLEKLFLSTYSDLTIDTIDTLKKTINTLPHRFSSLANPMLHFIEEQFNDKTLPEIFNFPTLNFENSLLGLAYLHALRTNTKDALLACCKNKKIERNQGNPSPQYLEPSVVPPIILDTLQQHIEQDISPGKNKNEPFRTLIALAQSKEELNRTNPELSEYFKPSFEDAAHAATDEIHRITRKWHTELKKTTNITRLNQ